MGPSSGPFVGKIAEFPTATNRNERKGTIKRESDGKTFQFRVRALDPNLSVSEFGNYLGQRYNFSISPDPSLAWNLNLCTEPVKAVAEKASAKGSTQAPKAPPKKQAPAKASQQKAIVPSNTSPTQASNTERKSGNSGEGISVAPCGLRPMKETQADAQPAQPVAAPEPTNAPVVQEPVQEPSPQEPAPAPVPPPPVKKEKGVLDDKKTFPPLGGSTKPPQQSSRKNQHGGRDPPKEKQPSSKPAPKPEPEKPEPQPKKQPEPKPQPQATKAVQETPPQAPPSMPPQPAPQAPPQPQPQPVSHQPPPPMQHQMPPQQHYHQVNGVGPAHRQNVVSFRNNINQFTPGQSCYIEVRDDDNKGFQLATATITDPVYSFLDLLAEATSMSADVLDEQRWEFREESGRLFVTHAAILAQVEGGVCVRVKRLGPHVRLQ